jgi:hypothetical protein
MSDVDIRHAATQVQRAIFNAEMAKVISVEAMIAAGVVGWQTQSWGWAGAAFLGTITAFCIPTVQALMAFAISLVWGMAAYWILDRMGNPWYGCLGGCLFAIILSAAIHANFITWTKDFATPTGGK